MNRQTKVILNVTRKKGCEGIVISITSKYARLFLKIIQQRLSSGQHGKTCWLIYGSKEVILTLFFLQNGIGLAVMPGTPIK
jgi:hypothetical protein